MMHNKQHLIHLPVLCAFDKLPKHLIHLPVQCAPFYDVQPQFLIIYLYCVRPALTSMTLCLTVSSIYLYCVHPALTSMMHCLSLIHLHVP